MLPKMPDKVHKEKIKVNMMECLEPVSVDDEDWMRHVFPEKLEEVMSKKCCFKIQTFSSKGKYFGKLFLHLPVLHEFLSRVPY